MDNFLIICVFAFLGIALSVGLMAIPVVFVKRRHNSAKLSAYECGIIPDRDPKLKFNINFFIVGILFLVFDIEIALLLPWALHVKQIGVFGFISVLMFTIVLTLGLLYEWKSGAVDI